MIRAAIRQNNRLDTSPDSSTSSASSRFGIVCILDKLFEDYIVVFVSVLNVILNLTDDVKTAMLRANEHYGTRLSNNLRKWQ